MKITVDFLKSKSACNEAVIEFKKHGDCDLINLLEEMIVKKYRLDWANWLIVRCMTHKQYVLYAIYAAEQVIDIFEKKYPDDKRPREAIEAAKKYIANPTEENRNATDAAAYAADAATHAADAAAHAADAAAHAADAAAHAAYAADAAAHAAYAAYAAHAAYAAAYAMRIKILEYGIKLLEYQTV